MEKSKEILQKYKSARNKRAEKDDLWHELDKFDRGQQWSGNFPKWIPRPVTNFIHTVKVTKRAAFNLENPTGQILPLTSEDKDRAQQLQRIYEFEWNRLKAGNYVRRAIETGKLLGPGIIQFYWDENTEVKGGSGGRYEGEVKMREIDPANFYPDPTAFTLDDCQFIHIVERKSIDWLKKHPTFGDKMGDVNVSNDIHDRGEIYQREYNSTTEAKSGLIDFHTHYEKIPNKEGGFTYKVTYLAGDQVVHTIDKLQPNCYPFAIYQDFPQRHDFWPISSCQLILENQKIINKVEAIIALIGTHLQNPQRIVFKGSGINPRDVKRYGTAPGHVFVSNVPPDRAMTWAQPPQIPQYLFQLMEQAKENIREVTGITQSYQGESVGSLQTSSGVEQLIERATMRDRDQMVEVEEFVEQMTRLLIKFIAANHTENRYIRYEEESNEEYVFERYNGRDYKDLDYEFRIDVSSKAPMSRQKQQEMADRLLEIQGQYGFDPGVINPEEFMDISPFPQEIKRRILKRMENERVVNNTETLFEIAMMGTEAAMNDVPPEEIRQMMTEMVEQREAARKEGIGSAHSGDTQNRQAGTGG